MANAPVLKLPLIEVIAVYDVVVPKTKPSMVGLTPPVELIFPFNTAEVVATIPTAEVRTVGELTAEAVGIKNPKIPDNVIPRIQIKKTYLD